MGCVFCYMSDIRSYHGASDPANLLSIGNYIKHHVNLFFFLNPFTVVRAPEAYG